MNYFLKIQRNQPKNKAHEELQQCVYTWNHALVDEDTLRNLLDGIRDTVQIINVKYPRCQDISLDSFHLSSSLSKLDENNKLISVEGNFYMSVHKVLRTETRDIRQTF